MRGYQHLSRDERVGIETLLGEGLGLRAIAGRLGRAPSTLSRELARNAARCGGRQSGPLACERGGPPGGYSAAAAQKHSYARARGRPPCKLREPSPHEPRGSSLYRYVLRGLDKGFSPEQICGRLRLLHPAQTLCHESIYRFIYAPARRADALWLCLPKARPKRRKRSANAACRALCDWALPIAARPQAANSRAQAGHWEIDTFCFSKPGLVIVHLVERVSRYGIALLLPGKESQGVAGAVKERLARLPQQLRLSLSCDRGKEFSKLHTLGLPVYACDPYSAWQKGSVENQNGLLRRYLPRAEDTSELDQEELDGIRDEINRRPRKVLGYRTPREVLSSLAPQAVALHL